MGLNQSQAHVQRRNEKMKKLETFNTQFLQCTKELIEYLDGSGVYTKFII